MQSRYRYEYNQLRRISKELDRIKRENLYLIIEIEDHKKNARNRESKITKLENDVCSYRDYYNSITYELYVMDHKLANVNCENEYLRKIIEKQRTIKDNEKRQNKADNTKHQLQAEIDKLKYTIENLQRENERLHNQSAKLKKDKHQINDRISENSADIISRQLQAEEINKLKSKIARYQKENEKLRNETNQFEKENHHLKERVRQNSAELDILKSNISSYQNEKENLKTKSEQLKKEKHHFEERIRQNSAENTLRQLQAEIDKLKSTIFSHQRENEKLNKEAEQLKTDKHHLEELIRQNSADNTLRQLQAEIDKLKSTIFSHQRDYEKLNKEAEPLKTEKYYLEERIRSLQVTSELKQCQNCWKYEKDISDLTKEVNTLSDRLSEAADNKLRDNNPNIADLSDMNRPTSLAEKFSTLYTDEYTDAMEVIEKNMTEADCAKTMLQWLKSCYDWCEKLATEQRQILTQNSIGFMQKYLGRTEDLQVSARCVIHVKEFQKKIAGDSLIEVEKICHIKSLKEVKPFNDNHIIKYIKKCSELCWMMQISDPPLCLIFDAKRGESLDRNSYNVFTKSGSKVDFLLWPVLYLHKTGPLLAKGVVQGM